MPAGGAVMGCGRAGCNYLAHSTQGHGFCCNACKTNGTHGPACEHRAKGGGMGHANRAMPAPSAPPMGGGMVYPMMGGVRPKGWQNVPGAATCIAKHGNDHWVVNNQGQIYHATNIGQWQNVEGNAMNIDVGAGGEVWCVNRQGNIFRRVGNSWTQIPGALKQVSVGSAQHVWGTNAQNDTFHWNGSTWINANHKLHWVSVDQNGDVWGIGPGHKGLFHRQGHQWVHVHTSQNNMAQVYVGCGRNNHVAFTTQNQQIWQGGTGGFQACEGNASYVAIGPGGAMACVNSAQQIFHCNP